jgi:hypothetical protein
LDIVKEQVDILNKGLLSKTTKVIVFITNYNKDECTELDVLLQKDKFILVTSPNNLYEKFAINHYKNYIPEKDYYVYYFHTKGLKHASDPLFHVFSSRRQILNYYTLEQYNINIKLLETYDAVGCSLSLYPKKHFSGNFWWSKSSYLQHLENINDKYLSPEMYVLSKDHCKYISLANDTNTKCIHEYEFPNEAQIEKNITSEFIVIEEHQHLMYLCE